MRNSSKPWRRYTHDATLAHTPRRDRLGRGQPFSGADRRAPQYPRSPPGRRPGPGHGGGNFAGPLCQRFAACLGDRSGAGRHASSQLLYRQSLACARYTLACGKVYTYAEIQQRDAAALAAWERDLEHTAPPGGETLLQMAERVSAAYSSIVQAHAEQTVALVAHGGPLQVLLTCVLGLPARDYWHFACRSRRRLLKCISTTPVLC